MTNSAYDLVGGGPNFLRQPDTATGGYVTDIVSHDGVILRVSAVGDEAAQPVICLHGGGQTRFAWKGTQALLADAGFLVMAVDMRGHGESGWAQAYGYRLDDFRDDVRAVAATCTRPPILVGASVGGIAALLAAGEDPRVTLAGLAMVDVSSGMSRAGNRQILDFMRGTMNGFASLDDAIDTVARYLPHRPPPTKTTGLMKNLRQQADGRLVWHWDPQAFVNTPEHNDVDIRMDAAAARLAVNTLLIRGEYSELVEPEAAEAFVRHMPSGEIIVVPGAHHMVVGDQNDLFSTALLGYCQKQVSDTGTVKRI